MSSHEIFAQIKNSNPVLWFIATMIFIVGTAAVAVIGHIGVNRTDFSAFTTKMDHHFVEMRNATLDHERRIETLERLPGLYLTRENAEQQQKLIQKDVEQLKDDIARIEKKLDSLDTTMRAMSGLMSKTFSGMQKQRYEAPNPAFSDIVDSGIPPFTWELESKVKPYIPPPPRPAPEPKPNPLPGDIIAI